MAITMFSIATTPHLPHTVMAIVPVISDAAVVVPAAVEEIQAVMAEGVEVIKRLFSRIALYSIAALIGYTIYAKANVPPETDAEYCKKKGADSRRDVSLK